MIKLEDLIKDFYNDSIDKTYLIESQYVELGELKIDEFNSYNYEETSIIGIPGITEAWQFEDRCGNKLVAVYLKSIGEFKVGYRIKEVSGLVFDAKKYPELIKPCPDDKRVNTIYKILISDVVPKYLLNKKPNRLLFNPVSESRSRLVSMIINKVVKQYPELKKKHNYIINV